ncbi:hypothetical protein EIP86_008130 [Pleurotus ostreatoroseus]|nr:hypothetical protein EIP86_008130 [Pleurotus ostreatoroseus]
MFTRLQQATYFAVTKYDYGEIHDAFEYFRKMYPNDEIRAALWNATQPARGPFLEMVKEDIQKMVDADIVGGFGFAQATIKAFKALSPNEHGKRGILIFTSATGARRGAPNCTVTAPGKFAVRALSQSLAKEFKNDDIHVSHAIIDGMIMTDRWKVTSGDEWFAEKIKDEKQRLHPASIAKVA